MGKNNVLNILIAVSLLLCFVGIGAAATINVGPGQEYSTIAEGVAAAQAGDTVNIAAGIYSIDNAVFLKSDVNVQGVGGNRTVIYTDSKEDCNSASNPAMLVCTGIKNVSISGITFLGPATSIEDQHNNGGTSSIGGLREARNGIKISGSNNIAVYNCVFTMLYSDGIRVSTSKNINIYNDYFDRAGHDSISFFRCENVAVQNCYFDLMINTCIRLYNVEGAQVTHSTFRQTSSGTGAGYIEFEQVVDNASIENNLFVKSSDPVLWVANAAEGYISVKNNALLQSDLKDSYSPYTVEMQNNTVYEEYQNWTSLNVGYDSEYSGVVVNLSDGIPNTDKYADMFNSTEEEDPEEVVIYSNETNICSNENCTALVCNNTTCEKDLSNVTIHFMSTLTANYANFSAEQAKASAVLANESSHDVERAVLLMNNNSTDEEQQLGQQYLDAAQLKLQLSKDLLNLSQESLDKVKKDLNNSVKDTYSNCTDKDSNCSNVDSKSYSICDENEDEECC